MRFVDRHPRVTADELVSRFLPPPRFSNATFASYRPDAQFPSQTQARTQMEHFASAPPDHRAQRRWFGNKRKGVRATGTTAADKPARYLDGGFGVGKTHLLAATWHATEGPKAYLTFGELTAFIGFAGMTPAVAAFRTHHLLCIDEFELDDVANTLMVVSFLRGTMTNGLRLAVTSNTLPDRLGEQRFSADDFRREITAIASYFQEMRVDGHDYRTTFTATPLGVDLDLHGQAVTRDDFDELLAHLRTIHPIHYGALIDGVEGAVIEHIETIVDQDQALLFVQFVDKLYDARIPVYLHGCAVTSIFHASYRNGGYRKKFGRAESRLTAMAVESATER